ncbi:hypothetical protein C8R46DRAFT_311413 [Mycena filopes]|nr:hypothetical protein C8R46DRAFT_311413 [Mycena filopes]
MSGISTPPRTLPIAGGFDANTPLLHRASKHAIGATPSSYGNERPPPPNQGVASYASFTVAPDAEYTSSAPPRVALVLENSGSVARDHLASERTFLAYIRTSLTIASAAVALAQLLTLSERLNQQLVVPGLRFETYARPIAVVSILLALYVLFVGVSRYFSIQIALTEGKFPATRFRLGIIAAGVGAIIASVFGLLVAERISSRG